MAAGTPSPASIPRQRVFFWRGSASVISRSWIDLIVISTAAGLWPQQRKQNHIANRLRTGEDHCQSVDADAFTSGWRQSIRERPNVILIHLVRFVIAALTLGDLR